MCELRAIFIKKCLILSRGYKRKKKWSKSAIWLQRYPKKIHKNVKTLSINFLTTSNFEVSVNIIVITKAGDRLYMANSIPLKNIEEEQQKVDYATVVQIAKIMGFLRNIED